MNTYVLITGFYYTYITDSVKSSKSGPLPVVDVSVGPVRSFHSSFIGSLQFLFFNCLTNLHMYFALASPLSLVGLALIAIKLFERRKFLFVF